MIATPQSIRSNLPSPVAFPESRNVAALACHARFSVFFAMLIVWSQFLFALVLLLPPTAFFQGKHVRFRAAMRDWDGQWQKTFTHFPHWLDLIRAALGAWLLATAVTRAPGGSGFSGYAATGVHVGVLAIAASLQTLICKEPGSAHAPFAFTVGLVCGFMPTVAPGLSPFLTLGFGLLLAIVTATGSNNAALFFPILALVLPALGLLFIKQNIMVIIPLGPPAFAALIPWLLAILFQRELVVPIHSKATPRSTRG